MTGNTIKMSDSSMRRWVRPAAAIAGGALFATLAAGSPLLAGHSPVACQSPIAGHSPVSDHSPVACQSPVSEQSPVSGVSPVKPKITVEIDTPVIRSANGKVVYVPVLVVCTAGPNAQLSAELTQKLALVTRTGKGTASAPCDNKQHVIRLAVNATSTAFALGKASVKVTGIQNHPNGVATGQDTEQVQIRLR